MRLLVLIAFLSLSLQTSAQEAHYSKLLEEANALYQSAAYDSALERYSEVLQSGLISYELYYNSGNCFYKTGDMAAAILYYERALKLRPNDADVLFNLSIANEAIVDKIDALPPLFFSNWWQRFVSSYAMDTWAWICVIMLFLTLISVYLFLHAAESTAKRSYFYGSIFCLGLTILSFLSAQTAYHKRFVEQNGIIFSSSITVQSAPAVNAGDLFVLHEGVKVQILREEGDWFNIRLADGNQGWVPKEALELI